METLQASIINEIKVIRSSIKRADELIVSKFLKKELQSIINEEINETFTTLCELGVIENKPSNDKGLTSLLTV